LGGGEKKNPGHNVAKEIKNFNWKESLKNNSLHGFFFTVLEKFAYDVQWKK
jgi:hypothetical protein